MAGRETVCPACGNPLVVPHSAAPPTALDVRSSTAMAVSKRSARGVVLDERTRQRDLRRMRKNILLLALGLAVLFATLIALLQLR